MKGLYSSPLRVYLCLAALALAGILAGLQLPISLFPNSSKPTIGVQVNYSNSTASEFLKNYGEGLEGALRGISTDQLEVEKVRANYRTNRVTYEVEFKWGSPSQAALREVDTLTQAYAARFPEEIRRTVNVQNWSGNSGFMAISFYSPTRSLDQIYDLLDPLLSPQMALVRDAEAPELYNPAAKQVQIELDPARMAALQILPRDVSRALDQALAGAGAGTLLSASSKRYQVQMPRNTASLEDLARVPVRGASGRFARLSDLARIDYALPIQGARSFKTNGAPSIILWASPKAGGNVKRMSEEILDRVKKAEPLWPKDIQYKVLVDPSEFIRSAISNVLHEVIVGSLLAVGILFLFIGSLRNTITAAIEIPLSMVLAFILMKWSGMNLNLISLGGLALSAGMNVDASVVVMENIFRHFEGVRKKLSYSEKLEIVAKAVSEVKFSVIASTIASLVVFIPLAFTSELSNAILGDLAKTVVFSHGFSAFVALILVPTVRLHLMSGDRVEKHTQAPIEKWIVMLENAYGRALDRFIRAGKVQVASCVALALVLAGLLAFVLPRLPKEIIGKPDTDWMSISMSARGNTLFRQMETQAEELESQLLQEFGSHFQYTFTQVHQIGQATVMARLKDKGEMREIWKKLEERFTNMPFMRYRVEAWNPAELPIPNPPQLQLAVQGGPIEERARITEELSDLLEEKQVLPQIWTDPDVGRVDAVSLMPNPDQWSILASSSQISTWDLADLVRVVTSGKDTGNSIMISGRKTPIVLGVRDGEVQSPDDLGALPIGLGGKIVPLRALMDVKIDEAEPPIYRENGREVFLIYGTKRSGSQETSSDRSFMKKAEAVLDEWKKGASKTMTSTVSFDDAEKDIHEALRQLSVAVALSILLIFLTLVVQFGSVVNAALVLVAVPLGLIGVLLSLFVFRSTLSLNSALGVILLNGIAVANSIILVDFQKRLVDQGMSPRAAAVEAGRKRLRPILITSMTTILAMLPVAFGIGEGGRILQPLGISVSGGLWVSMTLTLFIVPALQVAYLERLQKKAPRKAPPVSQAVPSRDRFDSVLTDEAIHSPVPAIHSSSVGTELLQ